MIKIAYTVLSSVCLLQVIGGTIYILLGSTPQKIAGVMSIGYGLLNVVFYFIIPKIFS